ncbi:tRNA glutamyl-Q(34) synthetase GluQRS [Paludibacterium yongneupense]|uniref:tRNA glutamyl-Q(34) synthetase GluQRS n=1 Tax=Paludibacterium yongneupense TaxID=400061 RepID=UPI000418EBC0|nr:tRNA glutamyl-Q(34) synthetase GluQRS [Paludibacterium yongneupense]
MTTTATPPYCGRFAPSPSGLLHAGSLTTAVGSYLEARCRNGIWRVRIEDLDPPREIPGASRAILATLEACGLYWDGEVVYQSRRHGLYREALERLIAEGHAYACNCSRREIALAARAGVDGMVYPGFCRSGMRAGREAHAWRLRVPEQEIACVDRLQGDCRQQLARDVGDFVLLRADGCWAYQLAVVVDDAEQGINDIVRGSDLLVSTPRQLWLQHCLAYARPGYCHLPLMVNAAGEKLSKQTLAPAISRDAARDELWRALSRLGHEPAADVGGLDELWAWAFANWRLAQVPAGPVVIGGA